VSERAAPRRDERGSVTPFAVACLGVLVLLGAALGVVAAMVAAHRIAQGAADLASLAAASAVSRGEDGCAAAASVASANGTRLTGCAVDGFDVTVTVEAPGPRWLGQAADLAAEARAGPG
jgi:secretion/DNA translocation related TadE-like protein